MNHFLKYRLAYAKGAALLVAQLAAGFAATVNAMTPSQFAAMDLIHWAAFFVGLAGSGAMLVAAYLSQAISAAQAVETPATPVKQ